MPLYNLRNCYWVVADNTTQVFSSASCTYVSVTDATYLEWLASYYNPMVVDSEQSLVTALAISAPDLAPQFPLGLAAYAQRKQTALQNGGVTVTLESQSIQAYTDAGSMALLQGAYTLALATPTRTFQWVGETSAVTLTAADIGTLFTDVSNFIQATFTTLATVLAGITAGTITTGAEIDAAAWPTS